MNAKSDTTKSNKAHLLDPILHSDPFSELQFYPKPFLPVDLIVLSCVKASKRQQLSSLQSMLTLFPVSRINVDSIQLFRSWVLRKAIDELDSAADRWRSNEWLATLETGPKLSIHADSSIAERSHPLSLHTVFSPSPAFFVYKRALKISSETHSVLVSLPFPWLLSSSLLGSKLCWLANPSLEGWWSEICWVLKGEKRQGEWKRIFQAWEKARIHCSRVECELSPLFKERMDRLASGQRKSERGLKDISQWKTWGWRNRN